MTPFFNTSSSYYNSSSVCLSVCLFVCLFPYSSEVLWRIFAKLGECMQVDLGIALEGFFFEKVNGSTGQTSLFQNSRLCRPQRVHLRVLFWKGQRGQRVKGQFFGAPDSVGLDGYTLLVYSKELSSSQLQIWYLWPSKRKSFLTAEATYG